ncbi:MAG: alpha-E domain-containing protein [Chloroflexi bacterium]|nr:MAG: alpha-E domain-containing protein [Chloroflexota bacterium]
MLSRAATSLALLGRHLERADHLARILGVHVALALDRTDEPGPDFWVRFMELAGWPNSDTGRREQAIEMVVAGTLGPSVRASVASARLAAQAVRPSLPTELYEQVNALHWRVQEAVAQPDLYPFLMDVQMSIRLVDGLLEDTMFHDEARDFVRLGKFIERAANVTRVVTQKSAELADSPEDALEWTAVLKCCFAFESYQARYGGGVTADRVIECGLLEDTMFHDEARDFVRLGKFIERAANVTRVVTQKSAELADSPEDALEWTAVLKCCFAFESYQARYGGGVTADRVIECLLLEDSLPRSARFATSTALEAVARIEGKARRSKPLRLLVQLNGLYRDANTQSILQSPLEFDAECRGLLRQLELALRETYFHPSKVPAAVTGEEGRGMPQQQQQVMA